MIQNDSVDSIDSISQSWNELTSFLLKYIFQGFNHCTVHLPLHNTVFLYPNSTFPLAHLLSAFFIYIFLVKSSASFVKLSNQNKVFSELFQFSKFSWKTLAFLNLTAGKRKRKIKSVLEKDLKRGRWQAQLLRACPAENWATF